MKYAYKRIISAVMAMALVFSGLSGSAFAANADYVINEETVSGNAQVPSEQTDYLEQYNNMSEEEQQQFLEEACNNAENAAARQSSETGSEEAEDADSEVSFPSEGKVFSEDGEDSIEWNTGENGEYNFLFDGSEDLTYDAAMENTLEGYQYVGTGSKSGMNVYKTTMTYDELEADYAQFLAKEEEGEKENKQLIEWANRAALSEEELEAAIVSADGYTEQATKECFAYVGAMRKASSSDAVRKYIVKRRAQGLGMDVDEEDDGDMAAAADAVSAAESNGLYANNMIGDDWVQIVPTENIDTDTIQFDEATIKEYGTDGAETGTQQQAQILIMRKDVIYFQVNQLDAKGEVKGGLNNALVTMKYKNSVGKDIEIHGKTACVDERDGYIAFEDMEGMFDCFINISFPGDATQTYYSASLYGGNLYTFNMRKVQDGDIYLRAAAIDNVDIMKFGYTLPVYNTAHDVQYNIKYLVDVYDPSGNAAAPEKVYIVSRPQRPEGWTWEAETDLEKRKQYRDKVFHPDSQTVTVEGQKSREYKKKGPWSHKTYLSNVPVALPEDGDDPGTKFSGFAGTRLVPNSKTYLMIAEDGKNWSETGDNMIELKLQVREEAPGWKFLSSLEINLFGMPTSTGQSAGFLKFNTAIPGLKNAELSLDTFGFKYSCAVLPSGYLIGGWCIPSRMQELVNTCKAYHGQELSQRPWFDIKYVRLTDQYKYLKDEYTKNEKDMKSYIEHLRQKSKDAGGKRQLTGNVSVGVAGFLMGVGEFNHISRQYGITVTAAVSFYGSGTITGYAFVGPIPMNYIGLSFTPSGTISGGVGVQATFTDAGHYTRFSPGTQVGLDLIFGITAFAGLGIRNFAGAEVTGGGNLGLSFHKGPYVPAVKITGGWDIGLRVYVAFVRWKSTIFSKNYQIYPKVNSEDGSDEEESQLPDFSIVAQEASEDGNGESGSDAEESQLAEFSIVTPEAEGRAVRVYSNDADGSYTETFEAYSECNDAGEYTDDTQVAKTTKLANNVAATTNIRYVSGKKYGGVLARVANVETVCADGKTRVLPRVVWSTVRDKEVEQTTYGVVSTYTPRDKSRFEEWELGVEYGYDYSFNIQMTDENYVDFTVVSGPVDQEERDRKAAEEALKKGEDPQKAIVRCRVANQHIRSYRIALGGPEKEKRRSVMISKVSVQDDVTKSRTHDYAYLGTPVVSVFKVYDHYTTGPQGGLSTWVACLISLDVFNDQRISDGYMIANWTSHESFDEDMIFSQTVIDGVFRRKLLLYGTEPEPYSGNNDVRLFSLVNEKSGESSAKTIQSRGWTCTGTKVYPYTSLSKTSFDNPITNLAHVNNNSLDTVYFTSDKQLYRANFAGYCRKIELEDTQGKAVELSSGDESLAYLMSKRMDDTDKFNIISITNEQDAEREQPREGEKSEVKTDAGITIFDFTPDASGNKFICNGWNMSEIKNRVISMFDAGFTQMGEGDTESSIKVYYMADYREEIVQDTVYDSIGEAAEIKTIHEKCDLFVWNWVATYGAKLIYMVPKRETVPYGTQSIELEIAYRNNGPKYIDGGIKIEYELRKGGVDIAGGYKTIEGSLYSGQLRNSTLDIGLPKNKELSGWLTVRARITEVKVNGEWITSEEAGFKPVYIQTGARKGSIKMEGSVRDDFDCRLFIDNWSPFYVEKEHLMVKVYRQSLKNEDQTEYTWEKYPSSVIFLNDAEQPTEEYYTWNCIFDTTNEKYWYSGLYRDEAGTVNITHWNDDVKKIRYDEITTAVRFELCGYGDDTFNVIYSDIVLKNPVLNNFVVVTVDADDPDALDIISGSGIYKAGDTLTAKCTARAGYYVQGWKLEDKKSASIHSDWRDRSKCECTPREGFQYVHLTAVSAAKDYWFHVKAFVTTDNEGTPNAQISAQQRRISTGVWSALSASSGTNEYRKFMSERPFYNAIKLTAEYDKSKFRLVGWYEAEYAAEPQNEEELKNSKIQTITYLDGFDSEDPTAVYETHYVPVNETLSAEDSIILDAPTGPIGGDAPVITVKAVFVPQDGHKITFDANGGSLIGLEAAYTDKDGYLTEKDIRENSKAEKEGYTFNGWYTDPEAGDPVRALETVFQKDSTVYAHYTKLSEHELTVTGNDPSVGTIEVDGMASRSIRVIGYTTRLFEVRAYPDEDYALDSPAWKAYSKDASGNYTVAESVIPQYDAGKKSYIYYLPDKDIKLVAQFKKLSTNMLYITLEADKDEHGYSIADFSVTAVSKDTDTPVIEKLRDGRYRLGYNVLSPTRSDIAVKAELYGDLEEDYVFMGWREFHSEPDGTIVIGDIISSENPIILEHLNSDKRLYAEYRKRVSQGISFVKSSVTIDCGFAGGVVNELKPPTDRTVTYSSSNSSIITVDPATGALGVPGDSGTVRITADIAPGGIYAREKAVYTLIINRGTQNISFRKSEITASLDGPSFKNEPEGAKTKVHYTSSNTDIAVVDCNTGEVTPGRIYGDAVITAVAGGSSKFSESTASYKVHITGLKQEICFSEKEKTVKFGSEPFTVTPNGAQGAVKYTSSKPSVAAVDKDTGKVTVKGAGTATISAKAAATPRYLESNTATYTLTANKADQMLSFAKESYDVTIGDEPFSNVLSGIKTAPHYTSSDAQKAAVNEQTGAVTIGNVKGDVTITVNAEESGNYNPAEASYAVHVNGRPQPISFSQMFVSVTYPVESYQQTPAGAVGTVAYESTVPEVATVDNTGKVTIKKPGETIIKAKAAGTDMYEESNTAIYYLTVNKGEQKLTPDETSISATAGESYTNTITGVRTIVSYSSSDPSVADAVESETGDYLSVSTVYAKKAGTAVIEARAAGNEYYHEGTAYYVVTVGREESDLYFDYGVVDATATATEVENSLHNHAGRTVTYTSSAPGIVEVSGVAGEPGEHTLKIKQSGMAIITASVPEDGQHKASTASYVLNISKALQDIHFKDEIKTVKTDCKSVTNTLTGVMTDAVYTSSDTSIAEVDSKTGAVTLKEVKGEVRITATAQATGIYEEAKASYAIKVEALEQEISFSQTQRSATYGDAPFTDKVNGAKGAVEYTSSKFSVAIVDKNTGEVTITGAGTATISAKAAATPKYLGSNTAEYTLTVSKAGQTLSFAKESYDVTIGDEPFSNVLNGIKTAPHYTSSDAQKAAVDEQTGEVTIGNVKGDVTVTVRAEESGNYNPAEASYAVHVNGRPQRIRFEQKTVRKRYLDDDFTVVPTGAVGTVTYESTVPEVATVDNTGKVTIIKPGETTIKAKAAGTDEYEESNQASYSLVVGKALQKLKLEFADISAGTREIHTNKVSGVKTGVIYTSNNETVALVTEGETGEGWSESNVYAVRAGSALIEVKATADEYYEEAEVYYEVTVDRVKSSLYFDKTLVTTITTVTEVANYLQNHEGRTVTYTSSAPEIVEVSGTKDRPGEHTLSIKKSGVAVITASVPEDGEYEASSASYVLSIRKAPQMIQFEKAVIEVRADSPEFSNVLTGAVSTVKYESSNTDVAEVDQEGKVTLKGIRGESTIKATAPATDLYAKATAEYTVKVKGIDQELKFDQESVTLRYSKDPFIAVPEGAKSKVSYYSSDASVATVNKDTGSVQLVHPGRVLITAIAEETMTYNAAIDSYALTVNKGIQEPVFEEASVTKRLTDGAFINVLKNAEGKAEYSVSDPSKASVDRTTGQVTMHKAGTVEISAAVSETEYYEKAVCSYTLDIRRGIQKPEFVNSEVSVNYGTAAYTNKLTGYTGTPKYSVEKYEPQHGIPEGAQGAAVDPDTGRVTILNSGVITIKAEVSQTEQYESAAAFYKLTIRPKSVTKLAVLISANTENPVVVTDGKYILKEGTDYRLRQYEKDRKTVYEVEGIGNYTDTVTRLSEKSQKQEVIELFEPEVSEKIPAEQHAEAGRMISKIEIGGFDSKKVPVGKIKAAVTGDGENKISSADMNRATDIAIAVNVKVNLESIDDADSVYKYSLDPYAQVVAWMADGTVKAAYTAISPDWLDGSRNIYVKLGVGNCSNEPNRVIHQTDSGEEIYTYPRGDEASGTKFAYDAEEKTVSFYIEHCSDVIIQYVETPAPKPEPEPVYSGGSEDSYDWIWTRDTEGYWYLSRNGHKYKGEWVYAYNKYAIPDKGHSGYSWFCFDEKGRMRTGWFRDKDGKWYYLETKKEGNQGAMYANCITPDGYRVDSTGAWDNKPKVK